MVATDHLKDVIKPIEEYHLSKFNLSWRMMNQYLYHSRHYADRSIYHLVTTFIEQVCFKICTFVVYYDDFVLFTDFVITNVV